MRKLSGAMALTAAVLVGGSLLAIGGYVYLTLRWATTPGAARPPTLPLGERPKGTPPPPRTGPAIVRVQPLAVPRPAAGSLTQARLARYDGPPPAWSPSDYWSRTTVAALDRAALEPATRPAGGAAPAPATAPAAPPWLAAARHAVIAWAKEQSDDPARDGDESEDAYDAAARAIEKGCTDPLVRYVHGLRREWVDDVRFVDRSQSRDSAALAAEAFLTDTRYPPVRRCFGLLAGAAAVRGAPLTWDTVPRARGDAYAEAAEALFPAVLAEPGLPPGELNALIDAASNAADPAAPDDGPKQLVALLGAVRASKVPESVSLTGEGHLHLELAWAARGGGYAGTVGEDQWRTFREELTKAKAALTRAWELDHANARAAGLMITVGMGLQFDRDAMDLWYDRAAAARPADDYAARARLLDLEPKWGGSPEQMLAFARRLHERAGQDPNLVRLHLFLTRAHWTLAEYVSRSGGHPGPKYFEENPGVFDELRAAYEPFLARFPRSRFHRTRYALIAAWCGQREVAAAQFGLLGGDYCPRAVPGAAYEQARARASAATRPAAGTRPSRAAR